MKFFKCIVAIALILLTWNSCTLFKKQIAKPVVILLSDTVFIATLDPQVSFVKYLDNASVEQYARAFLKGFKQEAAITKNVTLSYTEANPDFILKLKTLTLTEKSRVEKVNDPKSPYNGMEMVLNTVECLATLDFIDVKNNTKKPVTCTNTKSRSEQITNNRNLDDLINGANKDKPYRTKLLDDNICLNLSQDVGRRVWVPVSRRIAGDLK